MSETEPIVPTSSVTALRIPIIKKGEYDLCFHDASRCRSFMEHKERFGGNEASKKMQKNLLKQQFETFTIGSREELDSAYERFQHILSMLELHDATVSIEDANLKFLRSLPSVWHVVATMIRGQPGLDELDFDDLYNNLKVYEHELKGVSNSSSPNIAFLSTEVKGSTLKQSTAEPTNIPKGYTQAASSKVPTAPNYASHSDEIICSFFSQQASMPTTHDDEDLLQIDECEFDAEPTTFAMMALTEVKQDDWSMEFDAEHVHFGQDGLGDFDWSNKDDDTPVSLALNATNRESLEVILKTHEKNEYAWGDKYEQMEYDLKIRDLKLEEKQKELDQALKERDDFQNSAYENFKRVRPTSRRVPPTTGQFFHTGQCLYTGIDELAYRNKVDDDRDRCFRKSKGKLLLTQRIVNTSYENSPNHLIKDCNLHEDILHTNPKLIKPKRNTGVKGNKTVWITSKGLNMNQVISREIWYPPKGDLLLMQTQRPEIVKSILGLLRREYVDLIAVLPRNISVKNECDDNFKTNIGDKKRNYIDLAIQKEGSLWIIPLEMILREDEILGKGTIKDIMLRFVKVSYVEELKFISYLFFQSVIRSTNVLLHKNRLDFKVKTIWLVDNVTEIKNQLMNEFCTKKGFKRDISIARTPQAILVVAEKERKIGPSLKLLEPYLDQLGKFDGKSEEGYLLGYSTNNKGFRVYNRVTRKVQECLHVDFLENQENQKGKGPDWMFDLDLLTPSMNYIPVRKENYANSGDKVSTLGDVEDLDDQQFIVHIAQPMHPEERYAAKKFHYSDDDIPKDGVFSTNSFDDENTDTEEGGAADYNKMDPTIDVTSTPTLRIHKIHPQVRSWQKYLSGFKQEGSLKNKGTTKSSQPSADESWFWFEAMQEELLQFKLQDVWVLCDLPEGKRVIGTKWVFRNKRSERRLPELMHNRLLFAFASLWALTDLSDGCLRVVKALYGLSKPLRAWYERLSTFLLKHGYRRGAIDKTLFIKRDRRDIMLVQVYVDDIIFGSTKSSMVKDFEELMQKEFKMSSMGELTFFLGLQVKQSNGGIFLSQDKYVKDILNKFDFRTIKPASTPIEAHKSLGKDEDGEDVDVHTYRSMIGWMSVSWKKTSSCNAETNIVAISSKRLEYVAAASCCAQVLWMQNQLLDYGFNFMNTEIHIDNESTICIVRNPVFHSKYKLFRLDISSFEDCSMSKGSLMWSRFILMTM
ncbi:retrovirus-related pol polyprotein from transposon TNT 1-94 [Tanacetum coccineum]